MERERERSGGDKRTGERQKEMKLGKIKGDKRIEKEGQVKNRAALREEKTEEEKLKGGEKIR